MAYDESALRQYFEGKERLSTALFERNQLLQRLEALSQIPQREETFILDFDSSQAIGIISQLSKKSTEIHSLVDQLNIHAEQCSEPRVEIRHMDLWGRDR